MVRFLLIFFLTSPLWVFAQNDQLSNRRSKTIFPSPEFQLIDSLTAIPSSLAVLDFHSKDTISSHFYNIQNNQIQFLKNTQLTDSQKLILNYRIFSFNLTARYSHLDSSKAVIQQGNGFIGWAYDPYEEEEIVLEFRGLDYSGNFARGISVGNNQNLVLNSSFNLQMAGNLGDGIEVLAAISDNNIPLQPEGNTQQLNEFDKIFIQISKDRNQLIAGDYELARPRGYFMNYFKKLQGATFSNTSTVFQNKGLLKSKASLAIARGKFARNIPTIQEGNQGPYRLEGAEGERFIIVLAGTEKVWIDGKLLKRGLEEDYVIDYNAGHITFTQKQLITKDDRVIIEFEYADQNYLRSMYALNLEYKQTEKLRLYFNVFSQQDGRRPVDDEFSPAEERALKEAGDNPLNTVVSSVDSVEEFSAFRVLYKLVDTLGFQEVLVYSTDPNEAKYSAFFSLVGAGNGDYVLDASQTANGRVYRWVAPLVMDDTIFHQGEYAPVRQLVAPKQQQLYTLGAEYQLSKKSKIRSEIALSNQDLNRLSPVDAADNLGIAAFTNFENVWEFGKQKNDWRLQTDVSYEFVQNQFRELNPYRPAEFKRDWNVQGNEEVTEHIGRGGFQLRSRERGQLEYEFSGFLQDSIYTGTRHLGRYVFEKNGYDILLEGNLLNTNSSQEKSQFSRPKFNLAIPFLRDSTGKKYWVAGIYGEREKNERFAKVEESVTSDSLRNNSFWYDLVRLYLKLPSSENFGMGASFQQRLDYAPLGTEFEQSTVANELNVNGNWNKRWTTGEQRRRQMTRLTWNFTYRSLAIEKEELTNEEPAETFLGRLNYTLNLINGVVQTNTSYEIGSGQERKSQFIYLPVQPGEGTFIWRNDDNGDGVIQDNEIEIAPFQDSANVVRQVIFTDEFIRTNNIQFNQSLRFEPRAIWFAEKKGFKKLLSRFSTSSSLQISRKVKDAEGVSPWNPFQLDIADTALISTRSGIRNTLIFNPNDPKFSAEIGLSDNQDKVVLTSGFESRRREEQFFKTRWNITRSISTSAEFSTGRRRQDSEQFESKDYNIVFYKIQPQFTWLPVKTFRTILTYRYEDSQNTLPNSDEFALTHDFKLEARYNRTSTTSIQTSFSFVKIDFNGDANSPVGFAFLNGLRDGNNFLWNLTLDRRLARNIQLSLSYEGRKTGSSRMVHVGRAQVAATF